MPMIIDRLRLCAEAAAFAASAFCLMMVAFPLELTRPVQLTSVDPVKVEG